ncbi:MAG TPA: hypothetical protein VFJ46_21905 [Xanthobacteraceae bacterium]|jgi:high-affinity Fe2+/Pb2+ permease|nr:hypothetical protein [Xanthobacteraceae bacterium]
MLDWIGQKVLAIVTFVPALFVEQDSPTFMAVRAMFGLLLIVLIAYLIAMRPFRAAIVRCTRAISNLIGRKT